MRASSVDWASTNAGVKASATAAVTARRFVRNNQLFLETANAMPLECV
jgi:hypothetical protein